MKYRLLEAYEWDRLRDLVEPQFIPKPDSAAAAIAEDDSGQIHGVWFMQLTIHLEPLVLTSPQVNFRKLFNVLYSVVEKDKGLHFYAFPNQEVSERMAKFIGMKEIPVKVYEGEVP